MVERSISMRVLFSRIFCIASLCATTCFAADIPPQRSVAAIVPEKDQSPYFWQATSAGSTAQLLTLLCRSCLRNGDSSENVPLVTVLRDTLGDRNPENDRLSYVWLLSYSRPSIEQRALSAVPFFYWRAGKGIASRLRPGHCAAVRSDRASAPGIV